MLMPYIHDATPGILEIILGCLPSVDRNTMNCEQHTASEKLVFMGTPWMRHN